MRTTNLFSAVLSLFLLVPASITRAQTISSQKGLTTAVFPTQYGNVKVYLPDDIRPGETISGRIIAEPAGRNEKQIERNFAELKRYSVSINSEKFPVDNNNKPFQFLVHVDRPMASPMELIHVSGFKAGELIIPTIPEKDQKPAPGECIVPTHVLTGSPLRITGPFDGDASNTKCSLDGKPLEVLAESRGQCIVSYPPDVTGIKKLNVQENGKTPCSNPVSSVNMNISAGKLNLLKGERTYIEVNITGLQNLPDTALLTLDNVTADIVVMLPVNNIMIPLVPDSVGSGTFNKRFEIQSIRSGSFIINVYLDLPEVQPIWPPTKPQLQPGDSTVVQCPKCECSCNARIVFESSEGDVSTYRVVVDASCKGQYGPAPCLNCIIVDDDDYTFDWNISSNSDKPVNWVGNHDGRTVKIKNPDKAEFSLSVKVTIHCSDGTACTSEATTTGHPPTTTKPQCECHADCSILLTETRKDEVSFIAIIDAECRGNCYVDKVTYKWHIGESGKDIAEIDGIDFGKSVTVKLIKHGNYNLYLNGTVTCSDGSMCEFHCNLELTNPPPTIISNYCKREIIEIADPAMDGGLKINEVFPTKRTILRDDFIALGAEGADFDLLKVTCDPIPECRDEKSEILIPLSGRVGFKWEITNGKGSFVKLGCLYTKGGNDQKDEGEHVIFMPPVVPLPVLTKDTTITTTITLSIIDEKNDGMNDGQINRKFEIITHRNIDDPDVYKIEIVYKDKHTLPKKPAETKPKGSCEASHDSWEKKTDLKKPAIQLPDVNDNDKMVLGQWMVLTADNQTETDILKKIFCKSGKGCTTEPPVDKEYEDNVQWEWDLTGPGRLLTGRFGRYVIYEAPTKMMEGKQEMEAIIKVKVFNPDGLMATDDDKDKWSPAKKIKIYQPGIGMQYPASDWVPTENNSAALSSELKYRKDNKWEPALAHMCRIHFFELLNVSEEKGVCLNDPQKDKANKCRDMQLKKEAGHEAYEAVKPDQSKCTLTDQYMKARTQKPEKNYTIHVHSLDYGSYGLLKSIAKLETSTADNFVNTAEYISIPWTNATVKHLNSRAKKIEYKDNRVNIPYDIDENQIPDTGWITFNKVLVPDPPRNNVDDDDKPIGDGFDGDGLTNYEEYRGFKTLQPGIEMTGGTAVTVKKPEHVRTNNTIKNIFIHNKNDLPVDLYAKITELEVFEISELQYQSYKIRIVNFNSNTLTHVVDQKGLYLYDGGYNARLMGNAYSKTGQPARPNEEDSIVIYTGRVTEVVNKINKEIADENAAREKKQKGSGTLKPLDLKAKLATVVAHELCHGNNICHHGEGDESVEYDNLTRNPLRSGNISCVMRYDNHRKEGSGWYTGYFPETPGTNLCTSPAGTGYNANNGGHKDADPGRGACAQQLHISGVGGIPQPCPKKKKK